MKYLFVMVLLLTGCGQGEDIRKSSPELKENFKSHINYVKDNKGICYAILNNLTSDLHYVVTFTTVPVEACQ